MHPSLSFNNYQQMANLVSFILYHFEVNPRNNISSISISVYNSKNNSMMF